MLKVSIITITYNAEKFIEKTIRSVLEQSYRNIEYIIIDGKSTDRTLEIIDSYKDKIDIVISENDRGIYDAMNKGLQMATGDIINLLNAGDTYYDKDTVLNVMNEIINQNIDLLYAKAIVVNNADVPVKTFFNDNFIIGTKKLSFVKLCHQTVFYKKHFHNIVGEYNTTRYKLAADRHFLAKLYYYEKINFYYYDKLTIKYLFGGVSETELILRVNEVKNLRKEILNQNIFSLFEKYIILFKYFIVKKIQFMRKKSK